MAVITTDYMNFWFKKKKIVLDCFTTDPFSFEYCRIERAVKYYPQWWRDLPSEDKNINMKSCRGLIDLYSNSYVIPFWTTLVVEVGNREEKKFQWSITGAHPELIGNPSRIILSHKTSEFLGFANTGNYQHIKITSTWHIKTKSNTRFFYSDPIWHKADLNNYTVLPGIVEYKYNRSTETNIMFEYKPEPYTITLTPGMPMAILTPLTEEGVELRYHLITPQERLEEHTRFKSGKDNNEYRIKKKFIDEVDDRDRICPFKK